MQFKSSLKSLLFTGSLLATTFIFSSCDKVTEEQLKQLEELRREESSLKDQISETNSEISKLKSELSGVNSQLDKCNKDKQFVEDKLKSWPNVWPDWTPGTEGKLIEKK